MLVASMRIARGMGSKISEEKSKPRLSSATNGIDQVAAVVGPPKIVRPESVGNARLGFWLGERLLCT